MFAPWRSQSSMRIALYPITGKSFIYHAELDIFTSLQRIVANMAFQIYFIQVNEWRGLGFVVLLFE